jgi:pimeloyl-ACP methyl ester carboxylesterase
VTQDWGGPIGLATVEQRPAAFEGLVLANSWAWPITGDLHFEVVSHLMGGPLGRLLISRSNLFVNALIRAEHRLRKPTAAEMAHYRQALATPDAVTRRPCSPGASPPAAPFSPKSRPGSPISRHSRRALSGPTSQLGALRRENPPRALEPGDDPVLQHSDVVEGGLLATKRGALRSQRGLGPDDQSAPGDAQPAVEGVLVPGSLGSSNWIEP